MPALTTLIAGAGLALAAGSAYVQYQGQQKQQSAQREALESQKKIEEQRQRQMNLDAERRKREIIRRSIAQAGDVQAAAGSSGALTGSGFPGALGNVQGRAGDSLLGVNQNQEIGNNIFALNRDILGSYQSAAAGASMSAFGAGMGTLGGALLTNAGTLGKVGTYLGGKFRSRSFDPGPETSYA